MVKIYDGIVGQNLNSPVQFVVCWIEGGRARVVVVRLYVLPRCLISLY